MLNWLKKNLFTLIMVIGLVVGIGLLLYPSVANYWNSFHQTRAIIGYNDAVSKMSAKDYERILESARKYNKNLAKKGIRWKMTDEERKAYRKELSIGGSEVMAYVSLPKFHIKVPIYHGTEESVLQTAIGHIEGSSLPVGGKSTHCIISGHRGLPSARLFTDLDKVKEGDTWTITTLNETLTYECDQIRIVEPDDLSNLNIEKGEDLCTLVTCTPYGINTHRLLIRGHRIPNADGAADLTADAIQIEPIYVAPVMAVPAMIIILLVLVLSARHARKYDPAKTVQTYLKEKGLKENENNE